MGESINKICRIPAAGAQMFLAIQLFAHPEIRHPRMNLQAGQGWDQHSRAIEGAGAQGIQRQVGLIKRKRHRPTKRPAPCRTE
jgi:hypothetical protein